MVIFVDTFLNHTDTMTRSNTEGKFRPLSQWENWLAQEIVDIAFKIHRALGPGLLESVYEKCYCYELEKRGIPFGCQQMVPIVYDGQLINEGLRLDLNVDNLIIVELKAQEVVHPV
jgi:GxxExxY protein